MAQVGAGFFDLGGEGLAEGGEVVAEGFCLAEEFAAEFAGGIAVLLVDGGDAFADAGGGVIELLGESVVGIGALAGFGLEEVEDGADFAFDEGFEGVEAFARFLAELGKFFRQLLFEGLRAMILLATRGADEDVADLFEGFRGGIEGLFAGVGGSVVASMADRPFGRCFEDIIALPMRRGVGASLFRLSFGMGGGLSEKWAGGGIVGVFLAKRLGKGRIAG